jgi:hypothetical protein
MGSGSKRKGNDRVRINVPQSEGGGGSGGVAAGGGRDINQLCPMIFRVKIAHQLGNGTPVEIRGNELLANGESVGKLPSNRVEQLKVCSASGVNYAATTEVGDDTTTYIKFEQSS